jgi:hypothetical protein
MNFLLLIAIIYFSGVIANVLVVKIFNKKFDLMGPEDVVIIWLSWFVWLAALLMGIVFIFEISRDKLIPLVNLLNDKFKNWLFK